jgi:hypothetical protein
MSTADQSAIADEEFEVEFLSPDEARRFFDQQARYWFGISGEEFMRRYHAGEYRDQEDAEAGVRDLEAMFGFYGVDPA